MKKLIHVKKHLRKGKVVKAYSRKGSLAYKAKVDAAYFSGRIRRKSRGDDKSADEANYGNASSSSPINRGNLKTLSGEITDVIGKKPKSKFQAGRRLIMNADAENYPKGRFSNSHTWKGKKKK